MRAFTLTAAEDPGKVFDTVFIDDENGEITFASGAAVDLFDEIVDTDDLPDLDVEDVIEQLLGYDSDYLSFDEMAADQVAGALSEAERVAFNKKHPRRHGLFAPKGAIDAPSAAQVKSNVSGDSGGVEEVKAPKARKRTPKVVFNQLQRARQALAREEEKSRSEGRRTQSDAEVAARAKVAALDREMRDLDHSPITGESYSNPNAITVPKPPAQRRARGSLDRAIESGQPDALADYKRPALLAAAKKRNLIVPARSSDDDLRQLLLSGGKISPPAPAPAPAPEAAGLTMKTPITEVKRRARDMGIDITDLQGKQAIIDRIKEVEAKRPKTHTSRINAHSVTSGDVILDNDGKPLYVHGQQRVKLPDGQTGIELTVSEPGHPEKKTKKRYLMNQPIPRVVGGRTGGAGSFAAQPEFTLTGQELIDFNRKHARGFGGKFGRKLADLAGVGVEDQNTRIEFDMTPDDIGRVFDWDQPDPDRPNGDFSYLNIDGPTTRVDDETGEDYVDETRVSLHMTPADYDEWARTMSAALLRRKLRENPLPDDDPRALYIAAMLDLQDSAVVAFNADTNPWHDEQHLEFDEDADGNYHVIADDTDGEEIDMTLTPDEFAALHAQLMRRVGTGQQPAAAKPFPGQQTAAFEFQQVMADYAEAFAEWALAEFDISRMPERLQRYWTEGEGAAKVRWGTRGSFRRCRRALVKEGVPLHMVNGACANLYKRATGKHPGPHGRRDRTGPGRALAMANTIVLPTQAACGMCGNDQMMVDMPDEEQTPDLDAPSTSIGWRGPLAPIDIATGDRRRFAPDSLLSRQLPLPFRWQEEQKSGHDGAVVVGALTGYGILDEPYTMPNGTVLEPGTIMGEGYFLDPAVIPQAEKARYLVEHGLIGPSVDLEPNMDVAFRDEAGNTFDPHECQMDGTCPAKPEALITSATIAGATLVPITAFAEARAPELYPRTVADDMAMMGAGKPSCGCSDQVAAVRANGWDDLPFADRDREWDKAGVNGRLVKWATGDNGEVDLGKYGRAFLWHDEPADTQGAFKLPIADIIDGELTIVPHGVFAVAARLGQTDIPASAKQDVRGVLEDLYDQMADEFDDEEMHAPWDTTSHEMAAVPAEGCGCADKWARSLAAQTAASVFEGMEPYPADAFKMKADKLTPMTIEEREGEGFARIYGHIASWSSCNRGYRGTCVHAPRSRSGYANFHLGQVRTTEGLMPAGKIVMGEGHPDTGNTVRVSRAFYDATSKQIAWGRMHDDEHGAFFSGVLAPGVTAQEAATFLMSPPSGDWKDFELMAVLAVNVPGHVVPRASIIDGKMGNMVAAGRWLGDLDDTRELDAIASQFTAMYWEQEAAQLVAAFE